MDKSSIRNRIIKARLDLTQEKYLEKSNLIINKLKSDLDFQKSTMIGLYVSIKNEVYTLSLIEELLIEKQICLPKVIGKEMFFYQINNIKQLQEGSFGILEPSSNIRIEPHQIDTLIVPLVAYDSNYQRIGCGGGFYDRYLPNYNGKTIGLAFALQEVDKINSEEHDCCLSIVLNEKS